MLKEQRKSLSVIIRIGIGILLLLFLLRGVGFLVLLIGLSLAMSFIVNNLGLRQIGLELVTFIGVLAGMEYGPWIALGIAFALITYHLVIGGFLGTYALWVIPAYSLTGLIAGFLPQADVVQLGITLSIGINASNMFFTFLNSPGRIPNQLIYAVTNVIFNVFLFTLAGRPMLILIR